MERVTTKARKIINERPHLRDQVEDLVELCQDEIDSGESVEGEIELCLQSLDELVEDDTGPCPDDDNYPCSECGEPTGNGYDEGKCAQCLGE